MRIKVKAPNVNKAVIIWSQADVIYQLNHLGSVLILINQRKPEEQQH